MPEKGLTPEPLPDEPVLDDPEEDACRDQANVAELVAEDLEDSATPSSAERLALEDLDDKADEVGHPGFRVPTEPLDPWQPVEDVGGL